MCQLGKSEALRMHRDVYEWESEWDWTNISVDERMKKHLVVALTIALGGHESCLQQCVQITKFALQREVTLQNRIGNDMMKSK